MYRKPRFLEVLHEIREEMSREADYDVELFAQMTRSGVRPQHGPERNIRGYKSRAPRAAASAAAKADASSVKKATTTAAARRKRAAR